MQPVFRYRRWLEEEKAVKPEGPPQQFSLKRDIGLQSVKDLEARLPPLRGPNASVVDYVAELEEVEKRLLEFYDSSRYKKHTWDMNSAMHIEYQTIANSLLRSVGGSLGTHHKKDNPVLIGIGMGQFERSRRLSSLHGSFLSYFIPLVRKLFFVCHICD